MEDLHHSVIAKACNSCQPRPERHNTIYSIDVTKYFAVEFL